MGLLHRLTRSSHIHDDVPERFRRHLGPSGRILDAPIGEGENAEALARAGFDAVGGDLRPEVCRAEGVTCEFVDLEQPLPFEDETFDGVLHSEGIEHLDAQLEVLGEMARVLRPGGVLIVTTPNLLHLEGRINRMLSGHAYRNRAMVVETTAYWGGQAGGGPDARPYFGHVFLIDAFQLRFYLQHVGLEVVELDTTKYSLASVLLAPLLYPFVWLSTNALLRRKRSKIPPDLRRTLRRQVLSPSVLFGRKLVVVARKPAASRERGRAPAVDGPPQPL